MHYLVLLATILAGVSLAQERPIVVGVTVAQTGMLADFGASYGRGLALWAEEANTGGGMLGRRVELRIRDDQSAAIGVGELYEKLIDEDRVDLLLGPVGSAATLPASAVAEQRRRVLVNATGTDPAVLKHGNRYVFQVPAGAAQYGANVWPIVQDYASKRPLLVDRDQTGMSERLREEAEKLGIAFAKADLAAGYPLMIEQARSQGVDALIVAGDAAEAAEAVKALKKAGFAPRLVIATGSAQPEFVRKVGQDAEFVIGVSPYLPAMRTAGNAAFVRAYRAKHKQVPDFYAACGYAAGKVLEAALREAGVLDQEKIRDALTRVRVDTPLGAHEAGKDGAQAGVRPVLLQMQKGRREIVWPPALATAKSVPYPPWSERVLLK